MNSSVEQRSRQPVEPAIERDETRRRVANVQTRMQVRGSDVLLVADTANINYLTGLVAPS